MTKDEEGSEGMDWLITADDLHKRTVTVVDLFRRRDLLSQVRLQDMERHAAGKLRTYHTRPRDSNDRSAVIVVLLTSDVVREPGRLEIDELFWCVRFTLSLFHPHPST
jgi:hypothetical protein